MSIKSSTRLNKYISESGICSRREADRYIEQGNVIINGRKAKIGDQVFAGDRVIVNGNALEPKKAGDIIFLAFNKPEGITCTTEESTKGNIVDYVNHSARIFPIGRLDKDSQGLIFLTNDGDIVNKILRAGNKHEKEYLVTVNKPITDHFITGMANGVPILGETTKKCQVAKESPFVFKIILIQGLNRQIRRMCEHFGYEVTKLVRTRIMNINLKGLPVGDWRDLHEKEMAEIYKLIENSSSEGKNSASGRSSRNKSEGWDEKRPEKNNNSDRRFEKQKSGSIDRPFKKSRSNPDDKPFNKTHHSKNSGQKNNGTGKNKSRPPKGKSGGRGKRRSSGR
ncbi:MAG TPA: 23S rRNA pseudouridine(2604) synthase RluF [Cytophagaceae bacterium]|jgi:23S rRNA pseudouridine2604 synthase|nr:23S rRNA pseudouridine(2604) synthase RluF [Cytophagaceae bacterium]